MIFVLLILVLLFQSDIKKGNREEGGLERVTLYVPEEDEGTGEA